MLIVYCRVPSNKVTTKLLEKAFLSLFFSANVRNYFGSDKSGVVDGFASIKEKRPFLPDGSLDVNIEKSIIRTSAVVCGLK